ncbi:MAG: helix-turn-helix transcriptional regulator [Firmicutes bacterium]|nr:helix-turn-helix transcriptional regulator [Bacillota bacterium]
MTTQKNLNSLFSQRLKQLMTENNETIYTIASVVNLSPSSISRYINNCMSPKIPTIQILAHYFNVNPSWLMGTSEDRLTYSAAESESIRRQINDIFTSLAPKQKENLLSFAQFLSRK